MTPRKYSGRLYYEESNDYLDIKTFIVRREEIAFSLASVTQEHKRWEADSGRPAILQADGSYLAKQIQARQNGVSAPPWDIVFHIPKELGEFIEVYGTMLEKGSYSYKFSGELEEIPT